MSDTPPSIPPRKAGDASEKPSGGRTATETSPRGAGSTQATPTAPRGSASAPARPASGKPATSGKPAGAPSGPAAPSASPAGGTASGTATATKPAARPARDADAAAAPRPSLSGSGPRRVRLAISRVDPWSVMKLSFLMSVAIGIMIVVAAAVVWLTLDGLEVFAKLNGLIVEILADSDFNLMQYVEFDRVISVATLVAVVDVFLITALSTIGAFLYNITAALVGGVHVTMTDE
ncbi:MAG: DUF3566 domain-containing protein [Micrococcales bacterium]|nr:DUF3566 domain-containing protein [Micrococcales bacterium]